MRVNAALLALLCAIASTVLAGEIFPSQDTVDARKLQPGALVMLEPSAPMALNVNDLGIYSGAIDEGNRTKQKLLIETGRIFYWDEAEYRLEASCADSAVATALNIDIGSPIFLIERTSYSLGHRPVDYEKLHYRGDQIRFVTRLARRPTGARKGGLRK